MRRAWQPIPVFLPGEGQRRLVGCSPLGRKEWDMTEWLSTARECMLLAYGYVIPSPHTEIFAPEKESAEARGARAQTEIHWTDCAAIDVSTQMQPSPLCCSQSLTALSLRHHLLRRGGRLSRGLVSKKLGVSCGRVATVRYLWWPLECHLRKCP